MSVGIYIVSTIIVILVIMLLIRIRHNGKENVEIEDVPTLEPGSNDEQKILSNQKENIMENNRPKTLNEQLQSILRRLGFKYEISDDDIRFSYEGINMVVMLTDDPNYFSTLVPGIIEVEDYGELEVLKIAENINKQLKYVKAFMPHGTSLWLSYERQLHRDEVIEDALVEAIIQNLAHAYSAIGYFVQNKENKKDE